MSTPSSTANKVAPVTFTPWASASATPCMPGKDGSSAGWVLTMVNRERKDGPTSFMKPALTTRSGSNRATRSTSPAFQAARSEPLTSGWTKPGTPACSARISP